MKTDSFFSDLSKEDLPEETALHLKILGEFMIPAVSFCTLIRSPKKYNRLVFCLRLEKICCILYRTALSLSDFPQADESTPFDLLPEYVTEEEYSLIQRDLENYFEERDFFTDTYGEEEYYGDSSITSQISGYLADIYQPLSNFLSLCMEKDSLLIPMAVRKCDSLFKEYWGDRLLGVMRALHNNILFPAEPFDKDDASFTTEESKKEDLLFEQEIESFLNHYGFS